MEPMNFGGTELDIGESMVKTFATMNMRMKADEQEVSAASYGVDINVVTSVYLNDGAKDWPTTLAGILCGRPVLASSNRQELADLLTKEMILTAPFVANRLSRKISTKAKALVDKILAKHGYNTAMSTSGIGIRDSVKAGISSLNMREFMIKTTFHADGIELGNKWYAYERTSSYETAQPWYCFGVRFAGDLIPLGTVLAIRGLGISEFQNLDAAALHIADENRMKIRRRLLSS
jgi:hypothetical protein